MLFSDVCATSLVAVLLQESKETFSPDAYCSRKLTAAQTNYSVSRGNISESCSEYQGSSLKVHIGERSPTHRLSHTEIVQWTLDALAAVLISASDADQISEMGRECRRRFYKQER
ncbi:hypothetical protein CHS0354_019328 [Potamilus streckersoni]|uniref:Reverse transcriptase RNase H-like domain-containing protein n=1 Tax=Potamilus streckersoni TaxID=2493646 RepID=A0AAE0SIH6_9BIVA|nr:hypothetical protein CHS0354_019328 [Potamilus streckersoni]